MPSIAVKIDFAKALDTVHWDGLLRVLQARGFSSKWRDWVLHLLSPTRLAILVNGCPGPWIASVGAGCVRATHCGRSYS